ncbi:MAG: hypothetical protein N2C14_06100 [Planctomycetales bacterium]
MTEEQRKEILQTDRLVVLSRCVDAEWRSRWSRAVRQIQQGDLDEAVRIYFSVPVSDMDSELAEHARRVLLAASASITH